MFSPYSSKLRKNRPEDPENSCLGQHVRFSQNTQDFESIGDAKIVLLGYPDDRGVGRNQGRLGACEGPDEIRSLLYSFSAFDQAKKLPSCLDLGNFNSWEFDLLDAHEFARRCLIKIREQGARCVTLGGGHDWAFPDYVDLEHPILNVDAHLDLRPSPSDRSLHGHSGTPFRRILEESQRPLLVIGAQKQCNFEGHLRWGQERQCSVLFLEDLSLSRTQQLEQVINATERIFENSDYGLSIDMDAFDQSRSPGVSAPQAFGVESEVVLELIRRHKKRIQHLGIYESNPRYDVNQATARLAARFVFEFLRRQ